MNTQSVGGCGISSLCCAMIVWWINAPGKEGADYGNLSGIYAHEDSAVAAFAYTIANA